ncbi:MAG: acylphosphatase [Cyclobacteriaceae bacterium]
MIALSIQCIGKVQGVFFRVSTKSKADILNVNGWIRNEPDGSVLIHAEGSDDQVNKFLEWCRIGSQFARVDDVKIEGSNIEGFNSFEIKHS